MVFETDLEPDQFRNGVELKLLFALMPGNHKRRLSRLPNGEPMRATGENPGGRTILGWRLWQLPAALYHDD
jgi:hypothetical protein